MTANEMKGIWDRVKGLGLEFEGELTGDGRTFAAGQREELIGKLEEYYDMSREQAQREVEKAFRP
jgi:uncharacterized protein YjbJ (UPF0337 family)